MASIAPDALDMVRHGEVAVGDGIVPIAMAGEGPPLILLHGWTLDWRMWLPQVAELSRSHLLVMPDRRGFRRSTAPPLRPGLWYFGNLVCQNTKIPKSNSV